MLQEEVVALIKAGFPAAQVLVEGEGCSFSAVVIDTVFEGMGLLQKQKAVLATVKEQITSGVLHAVSVKAYTPQQWVRIQELESKALTVL